MNKSKTLQLLISFLVYVLTRLFSSTRSFIRWRHMKTFVHENVFSFYWFYWTYFSLSVVLL